MLSLKTEITREGIVCSHETLGQVATIVREFGEPTGAHFKPAGDHWYVRPYTFPPYERGAAFKSLAAAEFYAVALGCEMYDQQHRDRRAAA